MTNKCDKTGFVKALLKFLDTNEIEGKIFFGSIALGFLILISSIAFVLATATPEIIQAIKC